MCSTACWRSRLHDSLDDYNGYDRLFCLQPGAAKTGVERITKVMMSSLFIIMIALAIRSVTLEGAGAGIAFYLVPDFGRMLEAGIGEVVFAAMGQAFFTLSLGIGALAIFGSYISKDRSLTGEAVSVCALDTSVAFLSGLIIFPACFAFGIDAGQGPGLVFVTLPSLFNQMAGGQLWGTLFFIFMSLPHYLPSLLYLKTSSALPWIYGTGSGKKPLCSTLS